MASETVNFPTDVAYAVTEAGTAALGEFGVDVPALRCSRRRFAGACLDWTQRRPHLNGALGAAITARLLDLGWIERGTAPAVHPGKPSRAARAGQHVWLGPGAP